MSERMKRLILFLILLVAPIGLPAVTAQDIVVSEISKLKLAGDDIIEVESNPARGFNFPYFLFIPKDINAKSKTYMLVEPNNSGTATDDFEVHHRRALDLIRHSYANRIAGKLGVPLLVPVFPRPGTNWQAYTHALDRDTLEIKAGQLKRIDLQLLAMIDHAIELLRTNGFEMNEKVFMDGFSASAKFCNRFAFLHPDRVKAAACGGVNGLPTLPVSSRKGHTLPFPIGIADIETFTGKPFEKQAHRLIPQYIYMGYMDRNDTLPSRDAWSEEEAYLIREAVAEKMMPDRWEISRSIYREELPCAQCVTYNGVGHGIKDEMEEDLVKFFKANSGDSFVAIEPHTYPFVEYREIREAHVNALYRKGDKGIPDFVGNSLHERSFLISIREWLQGQDHNQLVEFVNNAGFNFRLCADGHPDIVITKSNYSGTSSMNDGSFQAFYVEFSPDQLKEIVPGVPYTLHADNKSDKYVWIINDGVTFVRTISYEDIILARLNSTLPGRIDMDVDITSAVKFLSMLVGDVEYGGETKQVHYELTASPGEIANAPRIRFSSEGLSVMEALMIICHRASLDYRIEGTTVYLESKR